MSKAEGTLSINDFKKDYLAYFLGVLIPGGINFLTIPVFKHLLGTADFGVFSYYFSILIIVSTSFTGGFTQGVIRLHIEYDNIKEFFSQSLWLSILLQILIAIPLFFYIQISLHLFVFSTLFATSLIVANIYITLLAITQAKRFSKVSAISETIRTLLMFVIAFILLRFFPSVLFLNALFISIILSYVFASIFLFVLNHFSLLEMWETIDISRLKMIGLEIGKYGGFLILWYFFSFGISLTNRFVLAHFLGKEEIGNYTASFDILNKSITVVLAPVVVSLFPILVKANLQDNESVLNAILTKISLVEIGLMLLSIAAFVTIGFPLLTYILDTPDTKTYLFLDIQVIVGSFIWQIALLQHKKLEMEKNTAYMVFFIAIAFCACFLSDIFLISNFGISFASTGFLAGGVVYIGCILNHERNRKRQGLLDWAARDSSSHLSSKRNSF